MKIENWKEATIGDVCKIGHGRDYKNLKSGDVPVYGTGGYMTSVDNYLYNGETVCIGRKGTIDKPLYHNGKIWTVDTLFYTYDFQGILPKYLYYAFCTIDWLSMNEASGVPSLTAKNISTITLQLPPLPEQQRIAKALSDVDALISTTEKLIQKKKNIKQGAMQNLLTGKKRLPGFGDKQTDLFVPNGTHTKEVKDVSPEQIRLSAKMKQTELGEIPEDWEVKSIKDFAKVYDGTHQTPHYVDVGIPFYSVENVTANDFEHTKLISEKEHRLLTSKVKIEKGDILMTRIGSIGDCKYIDWEPEASFYVSLALIKCDTSVDARFISYYSNSLQFKKELELRSLITAIPQKINLGPISEIILVLPPKEEQTAIANVLSSMDKEIETLNTKLEKYRNLKTAMMQQLLTGKIRFI